MICRVLTILAPSRFAGLLSGAQRLECDDGKQAVAVLPISDSPLGLNLGYSLASFLLPQNQAHEDAKTQLFVVLKDKVITRQLPNVRQ